MPSGFQNQARMTISSSGTGTFTLSAAVAPFNSFAAVGIKDGQTIAYSAIDGTAGSEKGWGVYNSSTTITLTRNVFTSTNSNNAIDASSSNTQVFIDPSAADLSQLALAAQANLGGL